MGDAIAGTSLLGATEDDSESGPIRAKEEEEAKEGKRKHEQSVCQPVQVRWATRSSSGTTPSNESSVTGAPASVGIGRPRETETGVS